MILIMMSTPAIAGSCEGAGLYADTAQLKRGKTAMAVVEVEVDIFSGMPNPAWTLTDADAAAFISKFAKLHKTEAKTRSGKLGYRGLIVRIQQGLTQEIYIQNSIAEVRDTKSAAFFLDRNRSLERWLLGTGTLTDDLLKIIDADLNN